MGLPANPTLPFSTWAVTSDWTRMSPAALPDAMCESEAEKTTAVTASVWPSNVLNVDHLEQHSNNGYYR